MKYCVSSRLPNSTLKKADEIKVGQKDIDSLSDLLVHFPDKTFIIELYNGDIDWKKLKTLNSKNNIVLCLYKDYELLKIPEVSEFRYYYGYPITDWALLRTWANLNPTYVILGAPLCFDLQKYKKYYNIPVRLYVNRASQDSLPKSEDMLIKGPWVRPNDIPIYEEYVDVCEFITANLTEEETYLKIYQEDKNWPGNLRLLIKDLPISVNNAYLTPVFAQSRVRCGQKCMVNDKCRFCETAYKLARKLDDSN